MLFNSYIFLLAFLPLTLALFALALRRVGLTAALAVLVAASLLYYAYWNPAYLWIILASIAGNFAFGAIIARARGHLAKALFVAGVCANLGLLGFYKYAVFLIETLGLASATQGGGLEFANTILPLGISFFTFQQIAYLADIHSGERSEDSLLRYALFVTFFPQLIAGPIVHHREMLPQFAEGKLLGIKVENLSIGLTIFAIGLFKKVVIADGVAPYSTPIFGQAAAGEAVSLIPAWTAALAYTFQLYFDFSGYSDMAVGAARLFGIRLPMNFNSPYKARNIVDFWRRWHMTLSRFLRDYVYVPLGGNRLGKSRRYVNLMATMLLGGLWHGAGWTFVLWGALHGAYLMINHAWRAGLARWRPGRRRGGPLARWSARLLTFLAVVVAWVLFRADSVDAALTIWSGMAGLNGIELPLRLAALLGPLQSVGVVFVPTPLTDLLITLAWLGALLVGVWTLPTAYGWLAAYEPALNTADAKAPKRLAWRPTMLWAMVVGGLLIVALAQLSGGESEFLYYEF